MLFVHPQIDIQGQPVYSGCPFVFVNQPYSEGFAFWKL